MPEDYEVVVMIAIGKPAPSHVLPEALQKMEAQSNRKPLKQIVMEGTFRQQESERRILL